MEKRAVDMNVRNYGPAGQDTWSVASHVKIVVSRLLIGIVESVFSSFRTRWHQR